jgi:hypothetical protein
MSSSMLPNKKMIHKNSAENSIHSIAIKQIKQKNIFHSFLLISYRGK